MFWLYALNDKRIKRKTLEYKHFIIIRFLIKLLLSGFSVSALTKVVVRLIFDISNKQYVYEIYVQFQKSVFLF